MPSDKKKNVIYVCTDTDVWKETALVLQREQGWTPKLFVSFLDKPPSDQNDLFYGLDYYSVADARMGRVPAQIKNFKLGAYDVDLFARHQNAFATFLEMMERYTILKSEGSWEQKKLFFIHMLRIWTGILDATQTNIVVMASRPHRLFDCVLETLCKDRGIPVITIEYTYVPKGCYGVDFTKGLSYPIQREFDKNTGTRISPEAQAYIEKINSSYSEGKPVSYADKGFFSPKRQAAHKKRIMVFKKKTPFLFSFLIPFAKNALKGQLSKTRSTVLKFSRKDHFDSRVSGCTSYDLIVQDYNRARQIRAAELWYKNHAVTPDLDKKFIFFPASFQPERSTCPDAGRYHDLSLCVNIISKSVSPDTVIYLKEHPRTFSHPVDHDAQRSVMEYEQIRRKCPNVVFIDSAYTPFELIDKSFAVALTTGTAGWEALLRGTPCLLFGDNWYAGCPGIFRIRTAQDAENALEAIEKQGKKDVDPAGIRRYINAIETSGADLMYMFEANTAFRRWLNQQDTAKAILSANDQAVMNDVASRSARQIINAMPEKY